MSEVLNELYAAAAKETAARQEIRPFSELEKSVNKMPSKGYLPAHRFENALTKPGVGVIAEFKRASPSEGNINTNWDAAKTAEVYAKAGAVAMSVLTIEEKFGGRLDFLAQASEAAPELPLLRKDFISNEYQLYEAAENGADAVLLIVAGLEQKRLKQLHREASELGLASLVEVHKAEELDRALEIEPRIIGVNNRNLDTIPMKVDLETTRRLHWSIPPDVIFVAESGYKISERDHKNQLSDMCANAVLIGTDIMRQSDPGQAIERWNNDY